MLGSLAGGGAVEILVALRDLSEAGFKKLDANIKATEATANRSSFGGLSKSSKNLEKDAAGAAIGVGALGKAGEDAAVDAEKSAGHFSGLGNALGGLGNLLPDLPGPLMLVGGAIAATAAAGALLIPINDRVQQQEESLKIAFANHGESLDALRPKIDETIAANENYGFNADQTRGAILQLTDAGLSFGQVQAALPHIMDLARAKNIDLATATQGYTSAVFGNARALKQYGILLPPVLATGADVVKMTAAEQKAQEGLSNAQAKLAVLTEQLSAKQHLSAADQYALQKAHEAVTAAVLKHGAGSLQATTAEEKLSLEEAKLQAKLKLTAADHLKLQMAQQRVEDSTTKLKAAQAALTLAHQGGIDKAARLTLVNNGLSKAIKDQRAATTPLQVDQAKLSDTVEHFARIVGPPMVVVLGLIMRGFSLLLDVVNNVLSVIARLVGFISHALSGPLGALAHVLGSIGNIAGSVGGAVGGLLSHLPHFAAGGVAPGGLAVVGERGPEIAQLPAGTSVYPHGTSPLVAGGGSHTIVVQLDGRTIAQIVDQHLGRRIALSGGTVLRPLGG